MLKKCTTFVLLLVASIAVYATQAVNMNLFFPMQHHSVAPALHLQAKPLHAHTHTIPVVMQSGSLKANITRIAKSHGWEQVLWNAPSDYQWIGETQIHAPTLAKSFEKLLADYPIQAVFYRGNHILVIQPRTLR